MEHQIEAIGTIPQDEGTERFVCPSSRHDHIVVIRASYGMEGGSTIYHDGVCISRPGANVVEERRAFSPDGKTFAVAEHVIGSLGGREHYWRIRLNGEERYVVPFDHVYDFYWISDDEIVWSSWDDDTPKDTDDRIRFFVNGQDVTYRYGFSGVLLERMRPAVRVEDFITGTMWFVRSDGSRTEPRPHCEWPHFDEVEMIDRENLPRTEYLEQRGPGRMVWHGYRSVPFDAIETFGGMVSSVLSDDGRKMAFIGVSQGKYRSERYISEAVAKRIRRYDTLEQILDDADDGSWWLMPLAWAYALLYSPYIGILYAWEQSARRYYPVVIERVVRDVDGRTNEWFTERRWEKGYENVSDPFFTPDGRLVVTSQIGGKVAVVVDEEEGPLFDEVIKVDYIEKEAVISYIAVRGETIYRVRIT